ncbi:YciI family protein [Gilvimarinus sp. DA14]|uniref:YciI family protein n=1 Tax=Gilvimarinus sp. DA14 TaxID=2956798 RepID=UPI0020B69864|nr:YciI family protein [Gilvimarinus sp. DA14]UTF59891.1 YciI family protein [Gilvimarinus sp. DA14]
MKYLCLVYSDEQDLHGLPDSPEDRECAAYAQSLADSGHLVAGEALQSVNSATTVRVRGGEVHITDGPFAETKEQLAGFYMIEAKDLNEALRIAQGIPPARVGSIEVRPVRQLQVD